MNPDRRTDGMEGRTGRTDAAKTISLRLRRGIKKKSAKQIIFRVGGEIKKIILEDNFFSVYFPENYS